MSSYEEQQKSLEKLWADLLEKEKEDRDEQNEFEESGDSSDNLSESDHQSASEQSADEDFQIQDPSARFMLPATYGPNKPHCFGRDKETKWFWQCDNPVGKRLKKDILKEQPGPSLETRHLKNIDEIWHSFFSNEFLESIVTCTNIFITRRLQPNYGRDRDARETNITEIKALIGLLYILGVTKSSRQSVTDAWATDGTGIEYFRLVMSCQRFRFLMRAIRFDDISTREERKQNDKLAPIRELFEEFVSKCRGNFRMGEEVTIDEMLEGFRGRCPFRQYISSKPARYGIKIFAAVDAACYYTGNLEIYAGKQPSREFEIDNRPKAVVLRLIQPITKTGRNITMDNWFTSVDLAKDLMINHNLTLVGTVRKNKRELPPILTAIKVENSRRPVGSSMFLFNYNVTLVSYVAKSNKVVVLLSTLHNGDEVDSQTQKPQIILDYNRNKGGVDTVDQMKGSYSVARNSRRWPLTIFFSMVNIGAINSQVIFRHNNPADSTPRSTFLKNLAKMLTYDAMKLRFQIQNVPFQIRQRIQNILDLPLPEEEPRREGRCHYCGRHRGNRTRKQCHSCHNFICTRHTVLSCQACLTPDEN